ncbi:MULTISPECIES: hypothetical protein [unclassified Lysinibacillus]|uniref:hypothetical protein n=1 Tax=unclassified Lysinibacillus TaxID=2636778 RepID=UPI00381A013F
MTHYEYMEQHGQMNMYDFLRVQESDHEINVDRLPSSTVRKAVVKKNYIVPRKVGYIVR